MAQFEALLDRKMEEQRRNMICAGIVAATVANTAPFGDPKRKALRPMDFVPEARERGESRMQSMDEQIAILKAIAENAAEDPN
jgi:hypothetical protein